MRYIEFVFPPDMRPDGDDFDQKKYQEYVMKIVGLYVTTHRSLGLSKDLAHDFKTRGRVSERDDLFVISSDRLRNLERSLLSALKLILEYVDLFKIEDLPGWERSLKNFPDVSYYQRVYGDSPGKYQWMTSLKIRENMTTALSILHKTHKVDVADLKFNRVERFVQKSYDIVQGMIKGK